ncbi:hypothetical protein GCM10027413_04660 [Conyzicola nivalis]|uniref:Uncharacterized protein n=1 Tax=Conyzicola nivalis TaxID=1477021 RepID=A0A916WJX9_9MICO|nr:hypothetical protein [Conyzicola nivalis]GGB07031.1 hypothetical protein GCM10010979_21970 [Conyzicola nivalis]
MTYAEAFELVQAGQGRWTVQNRGSATVAGSVLRTQSGFELRDLRDRALGVFDSIEDGLRFLLRSARR